MLELVFYVIGVKLLLEVVESDFGLQFFFSKA